MRWLLVILVACSPVVDGPQETQRAVDRADEQRLIGQLTTLPGVVRASVLIRRPARDVLGTQPAAPAAASVVVIIDDQADRGATTTHAGTLARIVLPDIAPEILVEVGAVRPVLAKVGPFTVEAASKAPLKVVLAIALAMIAALGGWIAVRSRRSRT